VNKMYIWRAKDKVLRHCGISIGFVKVEKMDDEYVIYNSVGVVATLSLRDNMIMGDDFE